MEAIAASAAVALKRLVYGILLSGSTAPAAMRMAMPISMIAAPMPSSVLPPTTRSRAFTVAMSSPMFRVSTYIPVTAAAKAARFWRKFSPLMASAMATNPEHRAFVAAASPSRAAAAPHRVEAFSSCVPSPLTAESKAFTSGFSSFAAVTSSAMSTTVALSTQTNRSGSMRLMTNMAPASISRAEPMPVRILVFSCFCHVFNAPVSALKLPEMLSSIFDRGVASIFRRLFMALANCAMA